MRRACMGEPTAIGVLTSGGDAQGMNAAVRAVVRTALSRGVPAYAIYEGYQGMDEGGAQIRPLSWNSVGGIQQRGGTISGRRQSIVVVAEGATDRHGRPISGAHVRQLLEERLGEDTRLTVLGHVQRGGAPSAFDRYQGTVLGYTAVQELLSATPASVPQLI